MGYPSRPVANNMNLANLNDQPAFNEHFNDYQMQQLRHRRHGHHRHHRRGHRTVAPADEKPKIKYFFRYADDSDGLSIETNSKQAENEEKEKKEKAKHELEKKIAQEDAEDWKEFKEAIKSKRFELKKVKADKKKKSTSDVEDK